MHSATTAQVKTPSVMDPSTMTQPPNIGNDPLAYLLIKLRLLGPDSFRKWLWPIIVMFCYFLVNDCLLPVFFNHFSSKANYIGPFDPLRFPNLVVDAILIPVLAYYYGQTNLLLPAIFNRLVENGIFGSLQNEDVRSNVERQRQIFRNWIESVWLTPVAIAISLWIAVNASVEYASPPRPLMYINWNLYILFFNAILWFLNFYMVAIIAMRFTLLALWLLSLQRKSSQWHLWLKADVLHPDNRMGFEPITSCTALIAKIIVIILISLVLILKGNTNIGLSPASPSWIGYLFILGLSLPIVISPIYLVHRFMQHEKKRFIHEMITQMGFSHTEMIRDWSKFSQNQQVDILMVQILLLRLAQLPDWPVTMEEIVTLVLTYLLGTFLTVVSAMQSILSFIAR